MFTDRSYFSVPVVGVTFDDRQHSISQMRVGEKLVLMREPNNPFDPNAIAVETLSGEQVGYLSRPMAEQLVQGMDGIGSERIPAQVSDIVGGFSETASLGVSVCRLKCTSRLHQECTG